MPLHSSPAQVTRGTQSSTSIFTLSFLTKSTMRRQTLRWFSQAVLDQPRPDLNPLLIMSNPRLPTIKMILWSLSDAFVYLLFSDQCITGRSLRSQLHPFPSEFRTAETINCNHWCTWPVYVRLFPSCQSGKLIVFLWRGLKCYSNTVTNPGVGSRVSSQKLRWRNRSPLP